MTTETFDREVTHCFACGKSVEQIRDMPRHHPHPASEADRCQSRPRKYMHLRCMYAVGHDCEHTAEVAGTGLHYWVEPDAVN